MIWLLIITLGLLALKENLFYLFLLQKKEYYTDKIADYLKSPESNPVIFNKWLRIRLGVWLLLLVGYLLPNHARTDMFFYAILIFVAEIVLWVYRVYKGRVKYPVYTNKAKLLIFLITLFYLILWVYILSLLHYYTALFWGLLYIILTPDVIVLCILLIQPLERYLKYRLIKRAKGVRDKLTNLKVIAISGAFGKTTTKYYLDYLLSKKFKVAKIPNNINTTYGIANYLPSIDMKSEYLVTELGAYSVGHGAEKCEYLSPTASIITGLNLQHFSLFRSRENIIKGESESLGFLKKGQPAILNWSSEMVREIKVPPELNLIKTGLQWQVEKDEVDFYGYSVRFKEGYTKFDLFIKSGRNEGIHTIKTNIWHRGGIQNLLNCIAYLDFLDFDLQEFMVFFETMPVVPGRAEIFQKDWGQILYNKYNNYDGLLNIMDSSQIFAGKKYIILDDIIELGDKSIKIHQDLAEIMVEYEWDKIILIGRSFRDIVTNKLIQLGFAKEKILLPRDLEVKSTYQRMLDDFDGQNNTVLLLGFQTSKLIGDQN